MEYAKDVNGSLQIVGGYCAKILWDLQLLLKFSIKSLTSDAYIREENGTLGGIGHQLINGTADIALPLSYLLPFRVKHIVALHPLVGEPMLAIFRQPTSTSVRDIYIHTLSTSMWTALVLVWVSFYLSYRAMLLCNHFFIATDDYNEDSSVVLIVAAISEQGLLVIIFL
jgi:hypothetical protein